MRLPNVTSALLAAMLVLPALTAGAQTTAGSATKSTSTSASAPSKPAPAKSAKADLTSVVNINTGTATELSTLPQIGKVRSAKIIAARPYKSVDELVTKKVLSQKLFDKLKSRLAT